MASQNNHIKSVSPAPEENHISRRTLWLLLSGIFLLSFSLLAFEITLARVLSVVLLYHFVFLVVSLALLGLGAGGIFVHLFQPQIPGGDSRFSSLAVFASLFALAIPFSVIVMTRIAYIDNVMVGILLYFLFLFIPFFFAGVFLANVFRMFPGLSSRIYAADLVGAAAGSLGVLFTLNAFGDINSSFFLALIAATAALLITIGVTRINIKGIILPALSWLLVLVLLSTNLIGSYLPNVPIGRNPGKEISQLLEIYHDASGSAPRGAIKETRWSAFGRTDLVAPRDDPSMMVIYIDGGAGTPMFRFNGDLANPDAAILSLKTGFPGYLPFLHLPEAEKDNALIIGPGGGRDVLLALLGGIAEITAVEVNPDLVDIVREYANYNGGIYTDLENVSVVVDEGRNFLKRQQNKKYDIIMLSLVVTRTSRSLEGFALTENFLYTTDAFNDYIEHLTDQGRLIIVTHDPVEVMKMLSISLTALEQRGVDNQAAMQQIYIVGPEHFPIFVLKKTPFEAAEMQSLYQSIVELGYDPTLAYLPTIKGDNYTSYIASAVSVSSGQQNFSDLEKLQKEQGLDLSPVTDDSPFFFKWETGIPQPVSLVLWSAIIILLLAIVVPFIYYRKRRATYQAVPLTERTGLNKTLLGVVVFFSMLGIGFMLVEISTIQRLILFLGQPVLSLAILLFSLLLGAGLGSLYSARFRADKIIKVITVVCLLIVALLLGYTWLLPVIFNQLLGFSLAIRLLATVVVLTPLGFLMGFPFPLGIRLLKEMRMENYIPWMWGINGVASVLGSALTLVIAISSGFTAALFLGAGCYVIAFFTWQTVQPKEGLVGKGGDKDG